MKQPKRSPWGPIQDFDVIAEGMASVGTASHGGIKLSRARNAKMPESVRRRGGWYEEDCEWSLVALVFPEAFSADDVEDAHSKAKNYYPEAFTEITGEAVADSESWVLRKRAFEARTRSSFVSRAAFGSWADWVPEGMVGVTARRELDGAQRTYLVPKEEYDARPLGFGFVVDELRHAEAHRPEAR